jgi:hypothetical protein
LRRLLVPNVPIVPDVPVVRRHVFVQVFKVQAFNRTGFVRRLMNLLRSLPTPL